MDEVLSQIQDQISLSWNMLSQQNIKAYGGEPDYQISLATRYKKEKQRAGNAGITSARIIPVGYNIIFHAKF